MHLTVIIENWRWALILAAALGCSSMSNYYYQIYSSAKKMATQEGAQHPQVCRVLFQRIKKGELKAILYFSLWLVLIFIAPTFLFF